MERIRASEILETKVRDRDGRAIGKVHDVRMIREGAVQGVFGPGYRVQALIVGPAAVGARLGFDRRSAKGPWALKLLFSRIRKGSWLVDWSLIESRSVDEIQIRVRKEDLPSPTGR